MAVIVKYIVVRNGEEKMTFVTKKEADAYDKMLDIADNLYNFLQDAELDLDETQLDETALLLAQRREEVMPILRGITPKKEAAPAKKAPVKAGTKSSAKKSGAPKNGGTKTTAKKAAKPKAAAKPSEAN